MTRESYVTLAMDDAYCIGALVLGASIRQTQTFKELTVLVTSGVSNLMRPLLHKTFDNIVDVQPINNLSPAGDGNLLRSELQSTFTKIHCWTLLQFKKCVFLDADTVVLHNIDELFQCSELSAVPDPSWPDYFNPGVFVLHPSMETYNALLGLATVSGSLDGTDQTLLNQYFADWCTNGIDKRLSYVYNCLCHITEATTFDFYTSVPAWVKFGGTIRVAHFAGPVKPWHRASMARHYSQMACASLLASAADRRTVSRTSGMLAYWWSLFLVLVRPRLTPDMYLGDFCPVSREQVRVVSKCSGDQTPLAPYCPSFSQHVDQGNEKPTDRRPTPPAFVPHHPEFHEQQWHALHHGQRVDQDNRFAEQHYSYRAPVPSPPHQAGLRSDQKVNQTSDPPTEAAAAPVSLASVPATDAPVTQEFVLPDGQNESQSEQGTPAEHSREEEEKAGPVSQVPSAQSVLPSETKAVTGAADLGDPVSPEQELRYSPTCGKCQMELAKTKRPADAPPRAMSDNESSFVGSANTVAGRKKPTKRRTRRLSWPAKPIQIGIAGELAKLKFNDRLCARHELAESEHMYAWERGEIDYTGVDRFENILKRLNQTLRRVVGDKDLPIGMDVN